VTKEPDASPAVRSRRNGCYRSDRPPAQVHGPGRRGALMPSVSVTVIGLVVARPKFCTTTA
jgi:hypothetical protein